MGWTLEQCVEEGAPQFEDSEEPLDLGTEVGQKCCGPLHFGKQTLAMM